MDNTLEFQMSGCIFTGEEKVDLDKFTDEFIDFCESKGWAFCGITKPLTVEDIEKNTR